MIHHLSDDEKALDLQEAYRILRVLGAVCVQDRTFEDIRSKSPQHWIRATLASHKEDEGQLKLSLRISPTSLLILRFIAAQNFFTVVSAYAHPAHLDGIEIGRWPGHRESGAMPAFCLLVPPPDPIVKVKKRREFELPAETKG